MKEQFLTYEQSLTLKELGFDELCIVAYFQPGADDLKYPSTWKKNSTLLMGAEGCTAPLKQQAFKFFREEHGLNSHIHQESRNNYSYCCGQGYSDEIGGYQGFDTYEEAEDACINKLIELAQNI